MRLTVEESFHRYKDRVFSAAFSVCQNQADADDVVQSTFLKYYTLDLTYEGEDGATHEIAGGGVAFDDNGQERPLTDEEIMEHLNGPEVEYKDDGSVWVYYMNQALEVTDLFEDGVCYVQLKDGDGSLYMTIKYNRGHATSPHKYLSPDSFNTSY